MFNRLELPSHPISGLPARIIIYPAACSAQWTKPIWLQDLSIISLDGGAAWLPPPPAHILNLPRLLTIWLAQNFSAPLTFPVPIMLRHPALARLSAVMNIEQNSALSSEWWTNGRLPIFSRSCPISLSPIFEPIADLCGCQPRGLGQLSLLARIRIGIWNGPKVTFQRRSY